MKREKERVNDDDYIDENLRRIVELDLDRLRIHDKELAEYIHSLVEDMKKLFRKLRDAQIMEKKARSENITLRIKLEASEQEVEDLRVELSKLREKYNEVVREAESLKIEMDQMKIKMGRAEQSFLTLMEIIEEMHEKMAQYYLDDVSTKVRREMEDNLSLLIDNMRHLLSVFGIETRLQTPIEIAKTKQEKQTKKVEVEK